MAVAAVSRPVTRLGRAKWIHGPARDFALSLLWVPFSVIALALTGDALLVFMGGVLLLSFTHQPLTPMMVYGDPANFRLKRLIFIASPLVFAAAILIGIRLSLALVAAIGGLWNAEHTLMQRYGVTRIYGRKGGDDLGGLEKPMLFSWLGFAFVFGAADPRTPELLDRSGLSGTNRQGIELLIDLAPYARLLLIPVAALMIAVTYRWVSAERALKESANPAKHVYLGSTALLFVMMLINPIAGLAGYVGSHAVEYFVIVNTSFSKRYARDTSEGGVLGSAVRTLRRPAFFALYGALALGLAFAIEMSFNVSPDLWAVLFFGVGGMHVFYDGFIWKLRQPTVAASLNCAKRDIDSLPTGR